MPINALNVLCAQPTHDLFAIAKFLCKLLPNLLSITSRQQIQNSARAVVKAPKSTHISPILKLSTG